MFYINGYQEKLQEIKSRKQDDFFRELAENIKAGSRSILSQENKAIPAGYTYFGQFIAHDISIQNNISSKRKPTLQLDAIYGFGPEMSSYLYEQTPPKKVFKNVLFRIWRENLIGNQVLYDIPRINNKYPLMGDIRNDENYIVSQLHIAFLRFHNALAHKLHEINPSWNNNRLFDETRKRVIYHYQYLIIHDYLKKLVKPQLVNDLVEDSKNFILYNPRRSAVLKNEFSQAAFRIGHSQVRETYELLDSARNVSLFGNDSGPNLIGFQRKLNRNIDWKFFFHLKEADRPPQSSNFIDQRIAKSLTELPFFKEEENNLVIRNFIKGKNIKIAKLLEKANLKPFSSDYTDMRKSRLKVFLKTEKIKPENLPAWLYFLLESEIQKKGKQLGKLGSRVVAEQIIWVLKKDQEFLLQKPLKGDINFTMDDFFAHRFSNVILS